MCVRLRQTRVCVWCPEPHLKAVFPRGDVHGGEVDHASELGVGVVPEEGQHGNHAVRVDHHLQLVVARHLEHKHTHFSKMHLFPVMTLEDETFAQYVLLYM